MIKSNLKHVLIDRKMTQTELVKRTGIRQPTISAIANDSLKTLPLNVLDRMCKELECNVGDLFEYIEE